MNAQQGRRSAMPKSEKDNESYAKALDEAIKKVYQSYGTNLSAFFRDAREAESKIPQRETEQQHVQLHDVRMKREKTKASR
jgi:hypothetical protein